MSLEELLLVILVPTALFGALGYRLVTMYRDRSGAL